MDENGCRDPQPGTGLGSGHPVEEEGGIVRARKHLSHHKGTHRNY